MAAAKICSGGGGTGLQSLNSNAAHCRAAGDSAACSMVMVMVTHHTITTAALRLAPSPHCGWDQRRVLYQQWWS